MILLRFTPPENDPKWIAWVESCRAAVRAMLAAVGSKPAVDAKLYKRQRDRLLEASHGKCAYCEMRLAADQRQGDVEHYRPKGRVRGTDGKVVRVTINGVEQDHPGYYWLAYDYTNLLPACLACNRRAGDRGSGRNTGKGDLFPTLDGHWAARPEEVAAEQPALLNPWLESDDPEQHLMFDPTTGLAIGLTERGRVTVEILGLNRDGLPEARKEASLRVRQSFALARVDTDSSGTDVATTYLRSVRDGSAQCAAVARVQLRQCRDELEAWLSQFP